MKQYNKINNLVGWLAFGTGFCNTDLCVENSKTGRRVDPRGKKFPKAQGLFCNDLWLRHRKRTKVCKTTLQIYGNEVYGMSGHCDAGKLYRLI